MTDQSADQQPVGPGFIPLLIGISAINPLSAFIYVTSIPSMTVALATNYATLQLTLSVFFASVAIAQIFIGLLSDRFGRRPVLLIGMALFALSSLVCAAATSIWLLLVARVFQGVGSCTGMVISRASVRDRYERERAASMLGYVTMGYAVAPALGPLIGGIIEEQLNWRWTFGFLFLAGVLALVASWWQMPETRRSNAANQTAGMLLKSFAALAALPAFWAYVIISSAAAAQFFAFLGSTPFLAAEILHVDPVEFGYFWVLTGFGYIFGNYLTGRFSRTFGIDRVILVGNLFSLAVIVSFALFTVAGILNPPTVFLHMLLCGIGQGLVIPNGVMGAVSVRPELAGAAAGLMGSLQMGTGAVVTTLIGTWLPANGTVWPMTIMMAAAATTSLLATYIVMTGRARSG